MRHVLPTLIYKKKASKLVLQEIETREQEIRSTMSDTPKAAQEEEQVAKRARTESATESAIEPATETMEEFPKEEPKIFSNEMFPEGVNNVFLKPREEADRLDEAYGKGKGIFENTESRDIAKNADKVQEMLAKYGAKEDATIVDLGAGTGLFLKDFAERVGPKGKVYACEISEAFAEIMRRKVEADETMASVIEVVVSPEDTLNLPSGSADLIFVCDVYHHLTYPVTIMRHCRRILKPDGHLVVVDFHRDDDKIWHKPKGWVYQHVRADQDTFRSEILSAGLELKEEPTIESLTENYIMVFTPAKATAPPSE